MLLTKKVNLGKVEEECIRSLFTLIQYSCIWAYIHAQVELLDNLFLP